MLKQLSKIINKNVRHFQNLAGNVVYEKESTVPTFCKLIVKLPYHVVLKPLDVHKYHNCDKLLIQICDDSEPNELRSIQYTQDGSRITLEDDLSERNLTCYIKAPIKANLVIETKNGNIDISNFNGDKIISSSESGTISINKFQGEKLQVLSGNGNINLNSVIQAAHIEAEIKDSGSIISDRLRGLDTKLISNQGSISVNSCYSDKSHFEVQNGDLCLKNIHGISNVRCNDGNIFMSGFAGGLNFLQEKGNSHLQLSKITEDSKIKVNEGELLLKLSEICQENIGLNIKCPNIDIKNDINLLRSKTEDSVILSPVNKIESNVNLECPKGLVRIESASWSDMFQFSSKFIERN